MKFAVAALLVLASTGQTPSTEQALPFSDRSWQLQGDKTRIARHDNRDVLQVETGFGFRRDVRLRDGTIDFDVQLTRRRSFVYLYFRAESDGEREEFYLRPHKSGLPDAAQYAPVWQGRSAWQLHHGPGATASIEFQPGAWTHVRLILQGQHAAFFVDDMATPALLVPSLTREARPGFIALGGFLPADAPGSGPIATFANVRIKPDVVSYDFGAALARPAEPMPLPRPGDGVVRAWAVSRSFLPADKQTIPTLPDAGLTGAYTRLETEPSGLLELHRYVKMPGPAALTAAVARIRIRAAQAGSYALDLGFSDIATVFLNGQPVFRGDGTYTLDRPRREGLIGFDQARIYLPLTAGDNELAVVVSDVFGGWGIMARLVEAPGLVVSTP